MEEPDFAKFIVENSMDMMAVYDLYGNCLYQNPASQQLAGDDATGTNVFDLLSGPALKDARYNHAKALEAAEKGIILENAMSLPDGRTIRMEVSVRLAPAGLTGFPLFIVVSRPKTWRAGRPDPVDSSEPDEILAQALAHGA